jgi:hypothetical protein
MNAYRLWAGPTLVDQVAAWLEHAGLKVTVRGTENVHVLAESTEQVLAALPAGSGWTWRDVSRLHRQYETL